MLDIENAILVTPGRHGWTWQLVDSRGFTTATGAAVCQADAMETAWRMARATSDSRRIHCPEMSVGGHAPDHPRSSERRLQELSDEAMPHSIVHASGQCVAPGSSERDQVDDAFAPRL